MVDVLAVSKAMEWYQALRDLGPYAPSAVVVAGIVILGLASAVAGRRLGCPPIERERLHPGADPEELYRQVLGAATTAGLSILFQEPGIRLVAFEGRTGSSYRRIPKEIEVRLSQREDGTVVRVTVRYLAIILVDSGEGLYAATLSGRLLGLPESASRPSWPLTLHLGFAASIVASVMMIYLRLVDPAMWSLLALEANAAILAGVILSTMAIGQSVRARGMMGGRGLSLVCLAIDAALLSYWTASYLLWL